MSAESRQLQSLVLIAGSGKLSGCAELLPTLDVLPLAVEEVSLQPKSMAASVLHHRETELVGALGVRRNLTKLISTVPSAM